MNLIGKNLLLKYIQKRPEAKTAVLVWYMGYPSREENSLKANQTTISSQGMSSLGIEDYEVAYTFNPNVKTGCINFIGTHAGFKTHQERKLRKFMFLNPEKLIIQERITITRDGEKAVNVSHLSIDDLDASSGEEEELIADETPFEYSAFFKIETPSDYEKALNKAVSILTSEPGSDEFAELNSLLPLIKDYEACHITFPELDLIEVIKLEMKKRQEIPLYLTKIFEREDDVHLFLSGKKTITNKILKALCKRYRIEFLYDDLVRTSKASGLLV